MIAIGPPALLARNRASVPDENTAVQSESSTSTCPGWLEGCVCGL